MTENMEGERILNVLKKRSEGYSSLCEDVKNYLSPVLSDKKKDKNALEFEKLELFSLKLFKLCIEQLQKVKERESEFLSGVATVCMDALLVCSGSSSKAPPLSFEKILLHFAKWSLTTAAPTLARSERGLEICQVLSARLRSNKTKSAETVSLQKLVHDILWKCALQLEQRGNKVGVASHCLNMRRVAVESLVLSGKFEFSAMFKSVMKIDLRYKRATMASATFCGCGQQDGDCHASSKPKAKCFCQKSDWLEVALEFHSSLEKNCTLSSLIYPSLSCGDFVVGIGYLLHYTLLCLKSTQRRHEGIARLSACLELCAKHKEQCSEEDHLIVVAQANCLQLWNAMRGEQGANFLDHSLLYLNLLTENLAEVSSSGCCHDNQEPVHWLAETLELVFNCLRKRREACRLTGREGDGTSIEVVFVPRNAFGSFKSFILSSVDYLEVILKVHPASSLPTQQEYSVRQNQLVLLSLLADAIVDLLSEDEIEIMRSSAPDPLTDLMAPPHPKKDLAECCIPLIKGSQRIIDKAGEDVLPVSERKWVANDAHRLGQALCNCDLLQEACQVLEVSCDEMTSWCLKAAETEEGQRSLSKETRLLERFINLCNVYCQSFNYSNAMLVIKKAITSLPTNQIAENETMRLLVSQWVRVKRHLANEVCAKPSMGRSLGSMLTGMGGVSDDVRVLYLESELELYQGQSHDTHSSEITIVLELLSLHSLNHSHSSLLHTARLTTRLATICRICHAYSHCDHTPCASPSSLLEETVALLEPLITSLTPSHSHTLTQAHQHLATAYLWRAISTLERNISSAGTCSTSCDNTSDKEKKIELSLSEDEQSMMSSDDIIHCLFSAVENWEVMMDKASPLTLPLSEVYHDPASMFHSLHLTATLCLAHSQPILALRCLNVLLTVGLSGPAELTNQLLPSYNTAVSLYNDLVIATLGPHPSSYHKPHPLPTSCDLGRREMIEMQCSNMIAELSSARVWLAGGCPDKSRDALLSMLSEPVLEQASTLTFMFVAKAKLLASELLQQRTFDLQSGSDFLHYVRDAEEQESGEECMFRLSPLELTVDAVKIFQKLASHRSVTVVAERGSGSTLAGENDLNRGFSEDGVMEEEGDPSVREGDNESSNEGAEESSLLVSSSVGAWDILIGLMSSLRGVAKLYLEQGIVKEAHHYAKEGALVARGLLLSGWYTEFLLLLADIESVKGDYSLSSQYCLQSSKLLECEALCLKLLAPQTALEEVGGVNQSAVEMAASDSFSDDDSFLDQVANLDIRTPPTSPSDAGVIKGASPLPAVEPHPQACLCQVCTNPASFLHAAKVIVQCSNVAILRLKDKLEEGENDDRLNLMLTVNLLSSVCTGLREMIKKRVTKCDKMLENVCGPSEVGVIGGCGQANPSTSKGMGSSRSAKGAPRKTKKKNLKSTSQSCDDPLTSVSVGNARELYGVLSSMGVTMAECWLLVEKPKEAIKEIEATISELRGEKGGDSTSKEVCLALAQLHYQMGVACVQEVELSRPDIAVQLWEESKNRDIRDVDQPIEDASYKPKPRSRARSTRKTATRKPRSTTSKATSSKKCLDYNNTPFSLSLEHFLTCYQLCFPSLPAVMTREVCQWVGLLLRGCGNVGGVEEMVAHFVSTGMNCTLTHQAVYCLGKKMRKQVGLSSSPAISKSTRHHVEEIQSALSANRPSNGKRLQQHDSLLRGRGLLKAGSTHPPSLDYTRTLRRVVAGHGNVCTLSMSPKTHPTRQDHLVIVRTSCDGRGVAVGVVKLDRLLLREFDSILRTSGESVSLKERREWWGARKKLDRQLKSLMLNIERDCLGQHSSLLTPDPATTSQTDEPIRLLTLILGRQIQHLPWESLPVLTDQVVYRMPSLPFMAAHSVMLQPRQERDGAVTFDPHSAYYILNPHGDLKNTEKRFANMFANERGWSGVIGTPPSHEEFAAALQEKDFYVYCGHSVGRFLASSGFQLLDCHATALLAGCSSGSLTVSGRCDPVGIPLSYLMAGCPALVGCLWDVTDGEIDRLCHALLTHLLDDGGEATPLPSLVAASRMSCKLQWLTGHSTIVYGMPVRVGVASGGLP